MARCVLVSNRRSNAGGQCGRVIDEPYGSFDLRAPFLYLNGFDPGTLLTHRLFSDIPKTTEIPNVISAARFAAVRCRQRHRRASRHKPDSPRQTPTRHPAQTTSVIA